jgi:hypothetical protein
MFRQTLMLCVTAIAVALCAKAQGQDATALEEQYKTCAKHYIPADKCTPEIYQQLKEKDNAPPQESSPEWRQSRKNDLLHAIAYDEFVLDGKYLTAPAHTDKQAPSIVLDCEGGHFLQGHLEVGAFVGRSRRHTPLFDTFGMARLERRRDGGQHDSVYSDTSNNGQAVFLDLLDFLYGHFVAHKEGKGELVHQWIYGVVEDAGDQIRMQFDMPEDQSLVLDSCTTLKKGKRR